MNLKINYLPVILVGFAGFISAADNWIASLLLPNIASDLNITISQASIVLTAYLIPYGVLQPIYGYYSDQYGRKKILLLLLLFLSISTFLCSLAPTITLLTICRFITGIFAAGIIAVSLGILGELYKNEVLTKLLGIFLGLVFLGQGLSSALGGWLIELSDWRHIFLFFSILSFISFLTLFNLPSSARVSKKSAFFTAIYSLINNKSLLKIYFLAFCNGLLVLGVYSFIGAYFSISLGISYKYVGIGLMLFGLVCFIIGFFIRLFFKILSPRRIIILGFSCSLIASFLLSLHGVMLTYLATMALGMGYALTQSILAGRALDLVSDNKGLSSGIVGVAIFGGGGIGTYLGSILLKLVEYQTLFLVYACLAFIPLFIIFQNKEI